MSRNHRGKRSKLSEEQRNQNKAIRWVIKVLAHYDNEKRELLNTCTESDNYWVLGTLFGVHDSQVVPCYGFDGCVLRDTRCEGALQK